MSCVEFCHLFSPFVQQSVANTHSASQIQFWKLCCIFSSSDGLVVPSRVVTKSFEPGAVVVVPIGNRSLDYWRMTWLQLNMLSSQPGLDLWHRDCLGVGGVGLVSGRVPLCLVAAGRALVLSTTRQQDGAGVWWLLPCSEQSQVTPAPWKRQAAGAGSSLGLRGLLWSNKPSGNSYP